MTRTALKPISCWKLFLLCLACGFAAATVIDMVPAYSAERETSPWVSSLD
jgi:hypothetical protein